MSFPANQTCRLVVVRALLVACACLPALQARAQDFNGDGHRDTVIGVPYEDFGTAVNAGAVDVIYGSRGPFQIAFAPQHWTLSGAGIPGSPQEGDLFGFSVAWGEFSGDQYVDLAIGIPGRDVAGIEDAGAIVIIYGSAEGLVASGSALEAPARFLRQGQDGVPGVPKHGDNFGFALASGKWTDIGRDYLAVGAPGFTAGSGGDEGRGEVVVLYFYVIPDQLWTQVVGFPEPGDWFGFSLTAGDFGRDIASNHGLAIGIPGEDVDSKTNAGAVEVLYMTEALGSPRRLDAAGAQLFRQSSVGATTQGQSFFGFSLDAGDLNGQVLSAYRDELVIGEPWRDFGFSERAGAIHVIYGSGEGLDLSTASSWRQGGSLPGLPETDDFFGFSVKIGPDDTLAVGAPGEDLPGLYYGTTAIDAGSVHIIHGGPSGLTSAGAQVLSHAGVLRQFGWSLHADADRLLVGAPGSFDDGGAVRVYRRDQSGAFVPNGVWTQDSIFGSAQPTESGDRFGLSLGAGGYLMCCRAPQ